VSIQEASALETVGRAPARAAGAARFRAALTPVRLLAGLFLLVVVVLAAAAPVVPGLDPISQDIASSMAPIGTSGHLLGTDELGRDVLSRLVFGARAELFIAVSASVLATVVGTLLGLLGGYFGGVVELLSMRVVADVLLAFPPVVLALLVVTIRGPGAGTLVVVMGALYSPIFARLVFGQTLTVRRAEYVEAARAYGAGTLRTLFRVVLPNVAAPVVVQFSLIVAASILLESGLSYLGLGIVPPDPSWGSMVAAGQRYASSAPALILVPSVVIVVVILSFSLLGDVLRDWLDPRGRRRRA
jgi:peptide/nickel transport system permease protein